MDDQKMLDAYYADSGIGTTVIDGKVWVLDYRPVLIDVDLNTHGTAEFYWKPLDLWYFQTVVLSQMRTTPEDPSR